MYKDYEKWEEMGTLHFGSKITDKTFSFKSAKADISRQKIIVETVIDGRDGTVKELISNGDYQLKIAIDVFDKNNQIAYPLEELKEFAEFLSENRECKIASDFLLIFGITDIVIKNYQVPQMTYSNYQTIFIDAVHDFPNIMKFKAETEPIK